MTTLSDWIGEVRDHLEGPRTDEANLLATPYVAGSGTMTFANALGNIGAGALLSVGLNTLQVTAVNPLTKTATVAGGQRGSTDAAATAGTVVLVNPRFTAFQIARALNQHLPQLSSPANGVYRVGHYDLSYTGVVETYDLPVTDLIRVLQVRRETFGPSEAWPLVEATWWDVDRQSDTASGTALRVRGVDTGLRVRAVYAAKFLPVAYTLTADVATTGISTDAVDIPPIGAAIRLMSGREVPRNQTQRQGDTRRANEVPPGAVAASYRGLVGLWQQRVKEESTRLRAQYPVAK